MGLTQSGSFVRGRRRPNVCGLRPRKGGGFARSDRVGARSDRSDGATRMDEPHAKLRFSDLAWITSHVPATPATPATPARGAAPDRSRACHAGPRSQTWRSRSRRARAPHHETSSFSRRSSEGFSSLSGLFGVERDGNGGFPSFERRATSCSGSCLGGRMSRRVGGVGRIRECSRVRCCVRVFNQKPDHQ